MSLASTSSPLTLSSAPLDAVVGMIGCGNMGKALARAWVNGGIVAPERLIISARTSAEATAMELGARAVTPREVLLQSDVIILGVKPQQLPQLASLWSEPLSSGERGRLSERGGRLFVSLLAGVSCARLPQPEGRDALVRVMPNIPAEMSAGATLAYSPTPLSNAHQTTTQALFGAVGLLEWLPQEELFHVGTAISGCGPAYMWVMIEALADAGVTFGLPRETAKRLAAQTMLGSGLMALEGHPALLKDRVTSPGGVTIEGVRALERAGVRSALIEAVACATSRSQDLDLASSRPTR